MMASSESQPWMISEMAPRDESESRLSIGVALHSAGEKQESEDGARNRRRFGVFIW